MKQEDEQWMRRALSLAWRGLGRVEPNPMVGCVLVRDGQCLGEGYHAEYGREHAEVNALRAARERGQDPRGCTAYVTLEPCSHYGKTPPCCLALIDASVARVVVATEDPSPQVSGRGLEQMRNAGLRVDVGVLQDEARQVLAPFLKRQKFGLPWVIAKWAMSLDGKLATRSGHSQWISGPASRSLVHQLRGRMDAILVGIGTAMADDPLLTARPAGPRLAKRVVVDRNLRLPLQAKLVQTAKEFPLIVATSATDSDPDKRRQLQDAGAMVWEFEFRATRDGRFDYAEFLKRLLHQLADEKVTNLLVEGGASVLGNLLDQSQIDEVYAFIAPLLVGGPAPNPILGDGFATMNEAIRLNRVSHRVLENDVLVHGFSAR